MPYQVIARRYRPQTFAEVCGQEVVARTLSHAIRKGKIAHAYLFTGPRGVGKTSMARILAKALICVGADGSVETPTMTPCGVCQHCTMITDSVHPDVAEIDAARFNGVDAIRELSDGSGFSPSLARSRVYILDEVHMLSASAWNALLKLLEEPPPHVRFIFATTEVDKILETVLSRVQRFDFRSIDQDAIVARLDEIAAKEGAPGLPAPLLHRLARAAGGGMRDAQTLLDQLLTIADGPPSDADLDLLLGAARGEELAALFDLLLAGDAKGAIESFSRISAAGVSPGTLLDQLVDHLRGLLLMQTCGEDSPAVRRLGSLGGASSVLVRQAKALPAERAQRLCQYAIAAQSALRSGTDPRLHLELLLVRLASLAKMVDLDQLLRRLERLESGAAAGPRPGR